MIDKWFWLIHEMAMIQFQPISKINELNLSWQIHCPLVFRMLIVIVLARDQREHSIFWIQAKSASQVWLENAIRKSVTNVCRLIASSRAGADNSTGSAGEGFR